MPATIKEIAAATRVSTASVSRALNGLPGVSPGTRTRILETAHDLGYTPDSRGRALATGKVPFLGLVLPDITNPFFPAVARGAQEEVQRRGFGLLLVDTDWRPDRLVSSFDLLTSRMVSGLLVAVPLNGALKEMAPTQERLGGAVVMVGQGAPRGCGFGAVDLDDHQGGYLVGQHLLSQGWRSVAYVAGPEGNRAARRRLSGLRKALADGGRTDALVAVSNGEWSVESGQAQAAALLRSQSRRLAIFAANDQLALGVSRAAAGAGRCLGEDLGLVGYDDIETLRHLEVPITSVAQPKVELGRRAAGMLLRSILGGEEPKRVKLRPRLVIRRSCGAQAGQEE